MFLPFKLILKIKKKLISIYFKWSLLQLLNPFTLELCLTNENLPDVWLQSKWGEEWVITVVLVTELKIRSFIYSARNHWTCTKVHSTLPNLDSLFDIYFQPWTPGEHGLDSVESWSWRWAGERFAWHRLTRATYEVTVSRAENSPGARPWAKCFSHFISSNAHSTSRKKESLSLPF